MTRRNSSRRSGRRTVEKAVGYVVTQSRLLVFTHDDVPLHIAGVQVPAGSIESAESSDQAVRREVLEETGIEAHVVAYLGVTTYDVAPARPELHRRHFYLLVPDQTDLPEQWVAGESDPSGGGAGHRWTCWWLPLADAHVLSAGFSGFLGSIPTSFSQESQRNQNALAAHTFVHFSASDATFSCALSPLGFGRTQSWTSSGQRGTVPAGCRPSALLGALNAARQAVMPKIATAAGRSV